MLGKLLKYEIKSTSKMFLSLFLTVLALSGINKLFMEIGTYENSMFSFMSVVMIFAYVLITLSSFIISLVIIIQRYYKNLFSNEGYLSFTLPVKPYMHIIAKSITATMWAVLNVIVIGVSLCILFAGDNHVTYFFQDIFNYFKFLKLYIGSTTAIIFIIEIIAIIVLSLIVQILFIYLSISIGNLFNKHKILFSFLSYVLVSILIQIANLFVVMSSLSFNLSQNLELKFVATYLLPILVVYYILLSFILFALNNFILDKHLNVE